MSSICLAITMVFFGVAPCAAVMIVGAARLAAEVANNVRRVSMSHLPDGEVVRVVRHRAYLESGHAVSKDGNGIALQHHGERCALHELFLDLVVQRDALGRIEFAYRSLRLAHQLWIDEMAAPGQNFKLA